MSESPLPLMRGSEALEARFKHGYKVLRGPEAERVMRKGVWISKKVHTSKARMTKHLREAVWIAKYWGSCPWWMMLRQLQHALVCAPNAYKARIEALILWAANGEHKYESEANNVPF